MESILTATEPAVSTLTGEAVSEPAATVNGVEGIEGAGNAGKRTLDVPALLARAAQVGGKTAAIEFGVSPNAVGGYRRAERIRLGLIKTKSHQHQTTDLSSTPPVDNSTTEGNMTPEQKSILEYKISQLTSQLQKLKAVIHELINAF